ncbi:hypothetical protein [Pedobacter sp. JCM 36344]|uniref:hypothetical protein n=1 Tax=Pedobacter sp. JCM 36344 TaxID=3374280 RepID=UPI00397CC12E
MFYNMVGGRTHLQDTAFMAFLATGGFTAGPPQTAGALGTVFIFRRRNRTVATILFGTF